MFRNFEGVNRWAICSMKLATIAFVLIVLKIWDGALGWVRNTNVWWFVAAFVIFVVMAGADSGSCKKEVVKKTVKRKRR